MVGIFRIKPVCNYVVLGPDGDVLKSGTAHFGGDDTFNLDLRRNLQPGLYKIMVAVYLNGNYVNPDVKLVRYTVKAHS